MDVVLLRTLTEKSKLGFGQYGNATIGEILSNYYRHKYLRWVYYEVEGITFTDEILEKLKIWDVWRIPKPGRDPDRHNQLIMNKLKKFETNCPKQALKTWAHRKKELKTKYKAKQFARQFASKKSILQAYNQGHR